MRPHLLLCMLAYLVRREMQRALAPLLFVDETPPKRPDPVVPAPRSMAAQRKDLTQRTIAGHPVHSFKTLLDYLGTVVKNWVVPKGADAAASFEMITEPTPLQQRAFDLLGVSVSWL